MAYLIYFAQEFTFLRRPAAYIEWLQWALGVRWLQDTVHGRVLHESIKTNYHIRYVQWWPHITPSVVVVYCGLLYSKISYTIFTVLGVPRPRPTSVDSSAS